MTPTNLVGAEIMNICRLFIFDSHIQLVRNYLTLFQIRVFEDIWRCSSDYENVFAVKVSAS